MAELVVETSDENAYPLVGVDSSHCIVIVDQRSNPEDDRVITVTSADRLITALRRAQHWQRKLTEEQDG